LLLLLWLSLGLVVWVVRPIGVALFLATVLAGALWPLQRRLGRLLGGRQRTAAGLLVFGVVVLLLVPIVLLSAYFVRELIEGLTRLGLLLQREGIGGLLDRLPARLANGAQALLERLSPDDGADLAHTVQEQLTARGGQAVAVLGALLAGTGTFLFHAALMLIALFFFLAEKARILAWIDDASPLAPGQTKELLSEVRYVSVAILRSTVLTAAVQTFVALVGYVTTNVPYTPFFVAITFLFAMVPAVGAAAVCLVAAAVLLLMGHLFAAVFLAAWGVVVVGLADNVVKPWLIGHGTGVTLHGAVVFFALLGGLAAFGPVGLLIGPLAAALFVAILRIYRRDYGPKPPPERSLILRPPTLDSAAAPDEAD
jgi:predicted PurR-regulated permease PerM